MEKSSNSSSTLPPPSDINNNININININNHSSPDDNINNNTTINTTTTNTENKNTNTHHSLKHLNKLSHKITKKLPHNQTTSSHPTPQHQPPVYNINKSDFRHVVQKLTGSPARHTTSSRLQKIRPPPLPQLRPPTTDLRPLSPLPAFPSVHTAAESPISAYMRYIKGSSWSTDVRRMEGWNNNNMIFEATPQEFPMPASPLG